MPTQRPDELYFISAYHHYWHIGEFRHIYPKPLSKGNNL